MGVLLWGPSAIHYLGSVRLSGQSRPDGGQPTAEYQIDSPRAKRLSRQEEPYKTEEIFRSLVPPR